MITPGQPSLSHPPVVRVRPCSNGCFVLYSEAGDYIGRTAHITNVPGFTLLDVKTNAVRMAYSTELFAVCQAADRDFENTGTVSGVTMDTLRRLLGIVGAP